MLILGTSMVGTPFPGFWKAFQIVLCSTPRVPKRALEIRIGNICIQTSKRRVCPNGVAFILKTC